MDVGCETERRPGNTMTARSGFPSLSRPQPTSVHRRPCTSQMNAVTSRFAPQGPTPSQAFVPQQQQPAQPQHKGTLIPGQLINVGRYQVVVDKYLSEGPCHCSHPRPAVRADGRVSPTRTLIANRDGPSGAQAVSRTSTSVVRRSPSTVRRSMSSSEWRSVTRPCWPRSGGRSRSWSVHSPWL